MSTLSHRRGNPLPQFFAQLDEEYAELAGPVLDYVFGRTDVCPDAGAVIHLSRIRGFCIKWAANRGFSFPDVESQGEQIKRLSAQLARADQQIAELQANIKQLGDRGPTRDDFIRRFGVDRGNWLFDEGLSLEQSQQIYDQAMKSGGSLNMARAALAQKLAPTSKVGT